MPPSMAMLRGTSSPGHPNALQDDRPVHLIEEYQDRRSCEFFCRQETQELHAGRRQLSGVSGVHHELGKKNAEQDHPVRETVLPESPSLSIIIWLRKAK